MSGVLGTAWPLIVSVFPLWVVLTFGNFATDWFRRLVSGIRQSILILGITAILSVAAVAGIAVYADAITTGVSSSWDSSSVGGVGYGRTTLSVAPDRSCTGWYDWASEKLWTIVTTIFCYLAGAYLQETRFWAWLTAIEALRWFQSSLSYLKDHLRAGWGTVNQALRFCAERVTVPVVPIGEMDVEHGLSNSGTPNRSNREHEAIVSINEDGIEPLAK